MASQNIITTEQLPRPMEGINPISSTKESGISTNSSEALLSTSLSASASTTTALNTITRMDQPPTPTLLNLPLEIRLKIYYQVLCIHPIAHKHLSTPLLPTTGNPLRLPTDLTQASAPRTRGAFFLNIDPCSTPISTPGPWSAKAGEAFVVHKSLISRSSDGEVREARIDGDLSIAKGNENVQGKLPTALLISCAQIYEEARALPWEVNDFRFVNWFWSGVHVARSFMRGLESWQVQRMRYVGVEVLGRELWVDGLGKEKSKAVGDGEISEWREISTLWSGIRGLRLGIKGSVGLARPLLRLAPIQSTNLNWVTRPLLYPEEYEQKTVLDVKREWVTVSLVQMTGLRWIEIEIEDQDVSRESKVRFCADLGGFFGEQGRDVQVFFVEKIKISQDVIRAETGPRV